MTNRNWIRETLTRKPLWWAAFALPILIALALALASQRHWQHRASALEQENLILRRQHPTGTYLARDSREWDAERGGATGLGYVFAALALVLVVAAIALLAFKDYARRQKSLDSRYKAIIDQANDGIVILDADTEAVLYSNAAFLDRLGYTSGEAQALQLRDVFGDGSALGESA